MTYRVTVTQAAMADTVANHAWWAEHHSPEQADRWVFGLDDAIQSLKTMPTRHGFATERELMKADIRQMSYGVGSRATHRVIDEVVGNEVVVYRIRSARQDAIGIGELRG